MEGRGLDYVQDRHKRRSLMNLVMNFRAPQNAGNFWLGEEPLSSKERLCSIQLISKNHKRILRPNVNYNCLRRACVANRSLCSGQMLPTNPSLFFFSEDLIPPTQPLNVTTLENHWCGPTPSWEPRAVPLCASRTCAGNAWSSYRYCGWRRNKWALSECTATTANNRANMNVKCLRSRE